MHVHLVFVAKYRRDVFTKAMLETMREVFERVCLDFEGKRPLNPTFSNSLIPR
jgi:putative transposase